MSILACLLGVGLIAYDVEGKGVVDVEDKGVVDVEGKDVIDIAGDATDSSTYSIIGKTSSSSLSGGSVCFLFNAGVHVFSEAEATMSNFGCNRFR